MKSIIAILLSIVSLSAFAESVSFQVLNLHSAKINGVTKLTIAPADGGKLSVFTDPNHCTPEGLCTKMPTLREVVEAKVISSSNADRELVLQLTPDLKLVVASGFSIDRDHSVTAVYDGVNYPLTSEVTVSAVK